MEQTTERSFIAFLWASRTKLAITWAVLCSIFLGVYLTRLQSLYSTISFTSSIPLLPNEDSSFFFRKCLFEEKRIRALSNSAMFKGNTEMTPSSYVVFQDSIESFRNSFIEVERVTTGSNSILVKFTLRVPKISGPEEKYYLDFVEQVLFPSVLCQSWFRESDRLMQLIEKLNASELEPFADYYFYRKFFESRILKLKDRTHMNAAGVSGRTEEGHLQYRNVGRLSIPLGSEFLNGDRGIRISKLMLDQIQQVIEEGSNFVRTNGDITAFLKGVDVSGHLSFEFLASKVLPLEDQTQWVYEHLQKFKDNMRKVEERLLVESSTIPQITVVDRNQINFKNIVIIMIASFMISILSISFVGYIRLTKFY